MSEGPTNTGQQQFPPPDQRSPTRDWTSFRAEHVDWIERQSSPLEPLYCLPLAHLDASLRLYKLDSPAIAAERAFAKLCDTSNAVGYLSGRPIDYKWLGDPQRMPAAADLQGFLNLGWDQSHIDAIASATPRMDHLFERMRAAAGRLMSSRDFEKDRDNLKAAWNAVGDVERPSLPAYPNVVVDQLPQAPLDASARPSKALPPEMVEASRPIAEFGRALTDFCGRWQLNGLATWDLPIPDGPKWSSMTTPPELAERGVSVTQTPFHFALQVKDGVGNAAEENHRQQALKRSVDDHSNWDTYAHFLPLAHWEAVFTNRYRKSIRCKSFMLGMEAAIAAILGVSAERAKRLRVHLKALKSGRITSLHGSR